MYNNYRGGYWHTGSEPEIECEDDLSTTVDATFEADLQSCVLLHSIWERAGNWFSMNHRCCGRGSVGKEIDSVVGTHTFFPNCDTHILCYQNKAQK